MPTTELRINQAPGEFLRVYVNDVLIAEVFGGKAETEADWLVELREARRLKVLPKMLASFVGRLRTVHNREDHNFPKPQDKVCAYLMGFADGLLNYTEPHPANSDFVGLHLRMQRDYAPCFSEGFADGNVIWRVLAALDPAAAGHAMPERQATQGEQTSTALAEFLRLAEKMRELSS